MLHDYCTMNRHMAHSPTHRLVSGPSIARRIAWAIASVMVLALLMAQTLGLFHRIVHSPQATHLHRAIASHDDVMHAEHTGHVLEAHVLEGHGHKGHGLSKYLFSGHQQDDADCRAYDQLGHFDAAPGCAAPVLPLALTPFLLSTLTGLATARWHALFQARGPPLLR